MMGVAESDRSLHLFVSISIEYFKQDESVACTPAMVSIPLVHPSAGVVSDARIVTD